ncbi:hypothetical protein DSECCO2_419420 [anaerobic digester metagenome]
MDTKEQMTSALFDNSVKTKVAQMLQPDYEFNGHKDRMPLELYDISFRLFRPTSSYINLEFLVSTPIGKYFQPVGLFDNNLNVYVLNEFANSYKKLKSEGYITTEAKFLDIKINAVIAAFSWQTILQVLQIFKEFSVTGWDAEFKNGIMIPANLKYDKRYEVNGYNAELLFSLEGYPQFYLDDDHGLKGAIGAYIKDKNNELSIHPTVDYKELYDKLDRLKLLTAFTRI